MILNSKITDFILPSFFFGFCTAFFFELPSGFRTNFGVCLIPFFSGLFLISTYALVRYREKNAASLSEQISSKRQVLCRGMASFHKSAINKIAGCLFLSDAAVEFYQTKGNICGRNIAIPLYDIVSITTKGTVMTIKTTEQNYSFSVYQIKEWEKQVNNIISQG